MSTMSENWRCTNYPPRISHRSSPIRLDAPGSEDPNSNRPPFGSRSPVPSRQTATRPSSTLLLLPGRPGVRWRGSRPAAAAAAAVGESSDHGRVRFDSVVQLILVPSRKDMGEDLSQELWWNQEDYLRFRLGAIVEDNAGLLRRPLRKKRSRRVPTARAGRPPCLPDPGIAQALQSRGRSGDRSGGMRPVRQHFKFRSLPSYGSSPSLGVQPATPPPSPEKLPCAGGATADRVSETPPAGSAPSPCPTSAERDPAEDFDGFVSLCGLPGPIATALEC